jgi:hypothetical protein
MGSDRHVYAPRSRFIQDQDLAAFDLVGPAPVTGTEAGVAPKPFSVDLKAAVRGMWK